MKTLLVSLIFSFKCFAVETMLFLDTNNNDLEIKTARTAALKAGKKFISYPPKNAAFNTAEAQRLLRETKFSSLIISGHNGGGSFEGSAGHISFRHVLDALEENPYSRNHTRLLMLLGCNTSNLSQIINWKGIFPELDIIAGYDGTGPNQNTISGLSYIKEIISNGDELLKQDTEEDLKRALESLPYIYNLEAGIYLNHITCNEDNHKQESEYIFRPLTSGDTPQFKKFDLSECVDKLHKLHTKIMPRYLKYFTGDLPIDTQAARSEMRGIYNFFHQTYSCIQATENDQDIETETDDLELPNWQTILSLRFWNETQHNIASFYSEELNNAADFLQRMQNDSGALSKYIEEFNKNQDQRASFIERLQKDKTFMLEELQKLNNDARRAKEVMERLREQSQTLISILSESLIADDIEYISYLIREIESEQVNPSELTMYLRNLLSDPIYSQVSKADVFLEIDSYLSQVKETKAIRELSTLDTSLIQKSLKVVASTDRSSLHLLEQALKLKKDTIKAEKESIIKFKTKLSEFQTDNLRPDTYRNLSRAEVGQMAHSLSGLLESIPHELHLNDSKREYLELVYYFVQDVSWSLDSDYIPFSWHEITNEVEEPSSEGTHYSEVHEIRDFERSNNKSSLASKERSLHKELYHIAEMINFIQGSK